MEEEARNSWWKATWVKVTAGFVSGLLVGIIGAPGTEGQPTEVVTEVVTEGEPEAVDEIVVDEPEDELVEPEVDLYDEPKAEDFMLSAHVTEKTCFGSAGCIIRFQVDAGWIKSFDPDKTYEVTYEVKGGENVLINTMRVEGEDYWVDSREMASTDHESDELTVEATSVRENL